jgi:hypothetical protein
MSEHFTSGKFRTGPCTVVAGGITLAYLTDAELQLEPNVVENPDVQLARGPLGGTTPRRVLSIMCKDGNFGPTQFSWASGYSQNVIVDTTTNETIVRFDDAQIALPEVAVTAYGTMNNGKTWRVEFKKAMIMPQSQTAKLQGATTEWSYGFKKMNPGDGSDVSGEFRFGN